MNTVEHLRTAPHQDTDFTAAESARKLAPVTPLHANKLFSRVPAAELAGLMDVTREVSLRAGEFIFEEGDPGDAVYVVKEGRVQISTRLEGGHRSILTRIGPGDLFGELAALDDALRSASASAETDAVLYRIPREYIIELLGRSPQFTLALVRDISHRLREFNRQYVRSVLEFERLSLVGRFANSIVHDLKNPLMVINMATELGCSENQAPERRKMARERIRTQVERITFLVNDILDFTRGTKAHSELVPCDYSRFVRNTVDELRDELQASRVTLQFENQPPGIELAINARRLNRVFHNLVGNALDEMPRGGNITLHFAREGGSLATEMQDSGAGIAPEILDRLFEPFATHGKTKGTGLGLSICQQIIEEHGGTISAHNAPAGGAVFRFTLPIPKQQAA